MMKIYLVNGFTRQYEEGTQPEGAVEVVAKKAVEPSDKAKKTVNKAKKAVKK